MFFFFTLSPGQCIPTGSTLCYPGQLSSIHGPCWVPIAVQSLSQNKPKYYIFNTQFLSSFVWDVTALKDPFFRQLVGLPEDNLPAPRSGPFPELKIEAKPSKLKKIRSKLVVAASKPAHTAIDTVVLNGQKAILQARFVYGKWYLIIYQFIYLSSLFSSYIFGVRQFMKY